MSHHIFSDDGVLKSCLCFDPSAPVDNRISRIANMNYARYRHSLIVAKGKLYAIGGWAGILHLYTKYLLLRFQNAKKSSDGVYLSMNFCDTIEKYDPQTNKWREVGKVNLQIGEDNSFNNSHQILFYCKK